MIVQSLHRLRPSVLDEFGLIKALQNMMDEWNDNQDEIFCDFSFSNIPDNLSESLKISLYRIIQESLTNTLKYSKASRITVRAKKTEHNNIEKIDLEIYDDGIGLDIDDVKLGFGLLGMKERVEMHNGKFEFFSKNE